jgi:hypothetical protein
MISLMVKELLAESYYYYVVMDLAPYMNLMLVRIELNM